MPINQDLARERDGASFPVDDLTRMLYGAEGMQKRRLAYSRAEEDPALKISEKFIMMSREELYDKAVKFSTHMLDRLKHYGYEDYSNEFGWFVGAATIESGYSFPIHHGAFVPSIKGQGTDEQVRQFLPKAQSMEYIGTYAQTELGHGTFLRGLETTAEYDKTTQEFILHSPTLTSIKYWPGGLGKTSNYAVVMAQLMIDGKNYGLHAFMCQLRDLDTHQPLSGIEVGDIGMKLGTNLLDNGYLKFDRYRIPRTNLLMKYCQVSPEGEYSRKKVPPQVTYLSMTYLRMAIVQMSWNSLSRAATIATRYSAVRRQSANSKGVELQILDYQTQQMKLFPSISTAYAFLFTGMAIKRIYTEILKEVDSGDISRLAELHCLTAGLKAYCSDTAVELIEVCRRACGGHGYSHASGIPAIFQQNVQLCTVEGENTVMYLQCARSLLKFLRKIKSGQEVPPTVKFLSQPFDVPGNLRNARVFSRDQCRAILRLDATCLIQKMRDTLERSLLEGRLDAEAVWTGNSIGLVEASKAFCRYLTAELFVDAVSKCRPPAQVEETVMRLWDFYIVNTILSSSGSILQNGVLSPEQVELITTRRAELLAALRPDAVSLVDAFDYPDRLLNSCLGRYDGNVYEALYEYAKNSSLNKQQVHPSFQEYVKPMRKALQSKL